MEQRAEQWTPENVAEFLKKIGLDQHADRFLEEDVDGPFLLELKRDSFQDLGVETVLDWIRITVLYRRELQGGDSGKPQQALLEILKNKKLLQYVNKFQHSGVDADMLLYASTSGHQHQLLEEVGITKPLHRDRLMAAVKSHFHSFSPTL